MFRLFPCALSFTNPVRNRKRLRRIWIFIVKPKAGQLAAEESHVRVSEIGWAVAAKFAPPRFFLDWRAAVRTLGRCFSGTATHSDQMFVPLFVGGVGIQPLPPSALPDV